MSAPSDEELNVRLAELCGWKRIHYRTARADTWLAPGVEPEFPTDTVTGVWPTKRDESDRCPFDFMGIPRYCSDLNECARVEAGLTDEQYEQFRFKLWWGSGQRHRFFVSATARQRTEALISTLTP